MRQVTLVGFALALALAGCMTMRPTHTAAPAPTLAESFAATATPVPTFCIVDGQESSCRDVLQMATARIENVDVLKGNAAAALYGSRARGGVVVVSTKH